MSLDLGHIILIPSQSVFAAEVINDNENQAVPFYAVK
jgi:hypothetical protein